MKKKYTGPMIQVVTLHAASQMLAGSINASVQRIGNDEGFVMDDNGLDGNDVLR